MSQGIVKGSLASQLNRRVLIQQPVTVADEVGGRSVSWSTLATVWAAVTSTKYGRDEDYFGEKLNASHRLDVTIRYRDDVTPKMRLLVDGEPYAIRSVENVDAADVILRLYVEAGVAA